MVMLLMPKNIKSIFLALFLIKLCVLLIDLPDQLLFTEDKNEVNKFITAILNKYEYCILVIKKHFHKNVAMTVHDENNFEVITAKYVLNCLLREIIK